MAALGNALGDDVLRNSFATPDPRRSVRPVIGVEEFAVAPRGCTITGSRRDDGLHGTAGGAGAAHAEGGAGRDRCIGDASDDPPGGC
jgi:hypothetical protein